VIENACGDLSCAPSINPLKRIKRIKRIKRMTEAQMADLSNQYRV
jgi:hypothetical protein